MKNTIRHIAKTNQRLLLLLLVFVLAGVGLSTHNFASASAATALLSVSPASGIVTKGSTLVVSVVVNTSGNTINDVQSVLTYPSSLLSYTSIVAGASFNATAPTLSSGSIEFGDSATAGSTVTGTQTVATVTFTATNTGTAAVNLATVCPANSYALTCSAAYDSANSDNDLASVHDGSFIVSAPVVVTPPPTSGGGTTTGGSTTKTGGTTTSTGHTTTGSSGGNTTSPSSTSAGTTSGGTTTTAPTTPSSSTTPSSPTISNIRVTNVSGTGATVTWQTDIASNSVVNYGPTTSYGYTTQDDSLTTDHSVLLNSPPLQQGIAYYYTVSSTATGGPTATSSQYKFMTLGFSVQLYILDKNGKPIENAHVSLGGRTAISNSKGFVNIANVPAGAQTVTTKSGNKTTIKKVTIGKLNPSTGTYQAQKFNITASRGTNFVPIYTTVLLIIILGLVVVYRGAIRSYLNKRLSPQTAPIGMSPELGGQSVFTPGQDAQQNQPIVGATTPPNDTKPEIDSQLDSLSKPELPQPGATVQPRDQDNNEKL